MNEKYKVGDEVYYNTYNTFDKTVIAKVVAINERKGKDSFFSKAWVYTTYVVEYTSDNYHNGQIVQKNVLRRETVSGSRLLKKEN